MSRTDDPGSWGPAPEPGSSAPPPPPPTGTPPPPPPQAEGLAIGFFVLLAVLGALSASTGY